MHRQTERIMFSRPKYSTKTSIPSKNNSADSHKLYVQYLEDQNFISWVIFLLCFVMTSFQIYHLISHALHFLVSLYLCYSFCLDCSAPCLTHTNISKEEMAPFLLKHSVTPRVEIVAYSPVIP